MGRDSRRAVSTGIKGSQANLLLARATAGGKGISIRAAFGAGRGRLVRQLVIESLMLALGEAVLGCLLAWNALDVLVAIIPFGYMPDEALTRVNGSVLLFTLGVVLVSTLLFGLAPALLAVTRDLHELLKASGRGAGESLAHGRLRNLLVVSEVTLSMVLLTGAGLLIRSFFAVRHVETGYNPDHVLAAGTDLPEQRYKTLEQRNQFCWEVLRRVRALPGVISAAFGDPRPLDPGFGSTPIEIAGKTSAEKRSAWVRLSSDGLFETMGIRLLQGRTISEEDMLQARKVAIVNRAFVTEHFGDENPLGQQIRTMEPAETKVPPVQQPWFEIVGVVADTKYNPEAPAQPAIYVPYMVDGFPEYSTLFVQSVGKPEILANSLRHVVVAIDNEVPLNWSTLRDELRSGW